MTTNNKLIDDIDKKIIELLQKDCRFPIQRVANNMRLPKSTIQYRIKKLETMGIIERYCAKINYSKLGKDYTTITLVQSKYGRKCHEKVSNLLTKIPGVSGIFFVLGDTDFVVICKSNNREDFARKLDMFYNTEEIEKTSTMVVMETIKDQSEIDFRSYQKEKFSKN
jgi:DNA-binding Lrp family transcriptional regulator